MEITKGPPHPLQRGTVPGGYRYQPYFLHGIEPMKAIDRVMRAYSKTRELTTEQAEIARRELSKFIEELISGPDRPSDRKAAD
jgi:hypothetical protein